MNNLIKHLKLVNKGRCCDNFNGEEIVISFDASCQSRINKNKGKQFCSDCISEYWLILKSDGRVN